MTDCVLGHVEPVEAFIGFACRRHYHWISDTLREIETLLALLPSVLLPGTGSGIRGGTMVDSPAPGRLDVMVISDKRNRPLALPMTPERNLVPSTGRLEDNGPDEVDVIGELVGWCRVVYEECEGARGMGLVTLRAERRWIAQQPWLDDYAASLAAVHRTLAHAVGDDMWPRPIGKCPNCGAPLFNTIGLDEVHCRRCRSTWAGVHLARLRLIHEQEGR